MGFRSVPKRIVLAGNKALASRYIRVADLLLSSTEHMASFHNLQQYRQVRELEDGTLIEAETFFGNSKVTIMSPVPSGGKKDEQSEETFGRIIVGSCLVGGLVYACRWSRQYGWENLGTLPGHVQSECTAISRDGEVIVGASYDRYGQGYAFRWTQQEGMVAIAAMTGGDQCMARAVSRKGGVIVGEVGLPATNSKSAFIWTKISGMQLFIPVLPPSPDWGVDPIVSYAFGVSGDGSKVVGALGSKDTGGGGWSYGGSGGGSAGGGVVVQPYLFDRANEALNLFYPDTLGAEATAISPDGNFVAGYRLLQDFFVWEEGVGFLQIPELLGPPVWQERYGNIPGHWMDPDRFRTNPSAISNLGKVTVGDATSIYNLNIRGFIYVQGGTPSLIPLLPGDTTNHGLGVSDDGSIVVGQGVIEGQRYLGYAMPVGKAPFSLGTISGGDGSMAKDISGLTKIEPIKGATA